MDTNTHVSNIDIVDMSRSILSQRDNEEISGTGLRFKKQV